MCRPIGSAAGFTLLEVLVAAAVLAVGLLGLSSLTLNSLAYNYSASLRTQAVLLSHEAFDRLRANRPQAEAGAYDIAFDAAPPSDDSVPSIELREWREALDGRLPDGDGAIDCDNNVCTVTVEWNDQNATDKGSESDHRKTVEIRSVL